MPSRRRPAVFVVAGPNGAGKTTFACEFLPRFARCRLFVNTDMIAAGLSPSSPGAGLVSAGRLSLGRIREHSSRGRTFAFETTLSGRTYMGLLRGLKARGYAVQLFFLWLPSVELALERVRDRVRRGGHSVPEPEVRRRFARGLRNLFQAYLPLLDSWVLMDNSGTEPRVVAGQAAGQDVQVEDGALWQGIRRTAGAR